MQIDYPKQPAWKLMLYDIDVDIDEVLSLAGLSTNWLENQTDRCSHNEYLRFWEELEKIAGERNLALLLAGNLRTESMEFPLSGALYQKNFRNALDYLEQVYPLVSPLNIEQQRAEKTTGVLIKYIPSLYERSKELAGYYQTFHLMFLIRVLRMGTRSEASPQSVVLKKMPKRFVPTMQKFCGVEAQTGMEQAISFSNQDMDKPFLTYNPQFENIFNSFFRTLRGN